MNLCPHFFELPNDGVRSKAITLVHESTHFTKNAVHGTVATDDWYVYSTCVANAARKPDQAIRNAESLALFAINHLKLP